MIAFETPADRGLGGDRAALMDAARCYRGDLLPDCTAEWIDASRDHLRQRARKVLVRLVSHLEQEGAFAEAIEYVQHLIRLDPFDEDAWCAAMRCHSRRGARAAASAHHGLSARWPRRRMEGAVGFVARGRQGSQPAGADPW